MSTPTSYGSGAEIICYAIEPPKLGKMFFKNSVLKFLIYTLHEVRSEKYKQADLGWNWALDISCHPNNRNPPSHVYEQILKKNISVSAMQILMELTFTQKPIYMEMYEYKWDIIYQTNY